MPLKNLYVCFLLGILFPLYVHSQTIYFKALGETVVETKIIDSLTYIKSFKDFSSLQLESTSLKDKLIKLGFIETQLEDLKQQNDSSYIALYKLNERYRKVRIYFDKSLNPNILKSVTGIKKDDYFEVGIGKLEETLQILNAEISNQGDPFSTLQLSDVKKDYDNNLFANLNIINARKRTIDSVIIKGYEKFPKSFVKRYLKIKSRQAFNLNKIKLKTSELGNLTFANQIKEPEILFTKDSTLLYIYIEKQKSNTFDGFLGFGSNAVTSKIELNGYLNLNLLNNLNYGESLKLFYKSDENEQKTFNVKAELPYILGSPLGLQLGLSIFKKDSTFLTVSQSAKLLYQLNSKSQLRGGINAINSTNLLDNSISFIEDYKSTFYTLGFLHVRRQLYDDLFPVNMEFDASVGVGNRTFGNTNESQSMFELNTFKIFNLNDTNSFYFRVQGSLLLSDTYFENELLRFGGINSIRGFDENSLTANLFTVINSEYRYKISQSIFAHTIIDVAYFENANTPQKGKLFGFGFGFGLLTKGGLLRLNYSNGKSENQVFKLSDSKIQISLTSTF